MLINQKNIRRQVIKQQKLPGLLPLLPLTKDGKSEAAVEEVIEGLEQAGRHDLLPLACLFAAYTFDTERVMSSFNFLS